MTVQTGEHSSVQDSQAAVRLYTMFRTEWEQERVAKQSKNIKKKGNKKKSSSAAVASEKIGGLEPSRLVKTKEASKSIGSRPIYAPSDSDED